MAELAISCWLTLLQAAQRAQCGPKLLRREIKAGRLRAAKLGYRHDIRIHQTWVDSWLEAAAKPVEMIRKVG